MELTIHGNVLTCESGESYDTSLRRFSDLSTLPAKLVAQPANYADIPRAIKYTKAQNPPLEIAIKGGGAHSSTWASSDGGLVIDLSNLKKVTISADKHSVVVQGGALWGDVYEVVSKEGLDVVGAPLWFVGVGGFTLGGGYGPLSGLHGLAIDNLLQATVVLVDGRIIETSSTEEPNLFWAIRGGGSQFGIVVEFVFKIFPSAGHYGSGILAYPGHELANVIKIIQDWKVEQTPNERFTLSLSRPAPHFKPSVVILPWAAYDKGARSKKVFAPFRDGPVKPVLDKIAKVPDMLTVSHAADAAIASAPRRLTIRGTLFSDFYPELLLGVWQKWVTFTEENEDVRASAVLWDLTSPGKLSEVDVADTALKVRSPYYWMAAQGRSTTEASTPAAQDFVASVVTYVREKDAELSGKDLEWFLNLCAGDENPEDVFGQHLPRLRKLKAKYDPENIWRKVITF